MPAAIREVVSYLLKAAGSNSDVLQIVVKTIFEMCTLCKEQFGEAEFGMIYTFLEGNYKILTTSQAGMLMEALCSVCSVLPPAQLP